VFTQRPLAQVHVPHAASPLSDHDTDIPPYKQKPKASHDTEYKNIHITAQEEKKKKKKENNKNKNNKDPR
jgi:hypothetical protein